MNKCIDCLFANNFARPDPLPDSTISYFLGIFPMESGPSREDIIVHTVHKYRFEHQRYCQRFPTPVIVSKHYGCGEFKDRFDVENEQPAYHNAIENLGSR